MSQDIHVNNFGSPITIIGTIGDAEDTITRAEDKIARAEDKIARAEDKIAGLEVNIDGSEYTIARAKDPNGQRKGYDR